MGKNIPRGTSSNAYAEGLDAIVKQQAARELGCDDDPEKRK